jgi:hypothetical protein
MVILICTCTDLKISIKNIDLHKYRCKNTFLLCSFMCRKLPNASKMLIILKIVKQLQFYQLATMVILLIGFWRKLVAIKSTYDPRTQLVCNSATKPAATQRKDD